MIVEVDRFNKTQISTVHVQVSSYELKKHNQKPVT